jgi:DNA invertase Pin-like site-specific DNA recombinase
MIIGYARTSTTDQLGGLETQLQELGQVGCERLFSEQASSVRERPQLREALSFVREGDSLVVTKLDRLARSVRDLWTIVEALAAKKVALRVLNMNLDTSSATGKLMLSVLGAVAEFEREMLLERQREGIARAKSLGKYKGRKPTARAKADEVRALIAEGMSAAAVATRLGISRASVFRIIRSGVPLSSSQMHEGTA